jgi:hypothetical protein
MFLDGMVSQVLRQRILSPAPDARPKSFFPQISRQYPRVSLAVLLAMLLRDNIGLAPGSLVVCHPPIKVLHDTAPSSMRLNENHDSGKDSSL